MASRGRQRKGGKRIDAAIDALSQLGFSPPLIRKTVQSLLKEYGGDDGWPFIEEASYKLVIETILEEQEEEEEQQKHEKEAEGESINGVGALEFLEHHDGGAILETSANTPAPLSVDWKDISCMDHGSRNALPSLCQYAASTREKVGGPSNVSSKVGPSHIQPIVSSGPRSPSHIQQLKPRRKPCYGWISESEDEDEKEGSQFVANGAMDQKTEKIGEQCRKKKRKSGWDVKPLSMY